jgi:hypothetical protein
MLAPLGKPLVVTVNVPTEPSVNVAWSGLVILGLCKTVRVKLWVASGAMPLLAFMVIG